MTKSIRDVAIAAFFLVLSGTLIFGFRIGQDAYEDFKLAKKAELEQIENLTSTAKHSAALFEELSILITARILEDADTLPASTADEFVRDSIQVIKQDHSERVGKLLEAVNDAYLRKRNK